MIFEILGNQNAIHKRVFKLGIMYSQNYYNNMRLNNQFVDMVCYGKLEFFV